MVKTDYQKMLCRVLCLLFFSCALSRSVFATEVLINNSFELPVAPANGNNFYATIPNWTSVPSPAVGLPANIVVPTAAYANNPTSTPAGGGRQYFDMNSAGGFLRQSVTLATSGKVSISTWYSVRDFVQNISGLTVKLINSSGTTVATATTSFTTADPIGLWKQATLSSVSVPAGTYTFEIYLDNYNNIDLASLDFVADNPQLSITKTSNATTPVIVGQTITYTYIVKNIGNVAMTNVKVGDIHNGFGSAPIPKNETLFNDVVPVSDSTDSASNNGFWDVLGPGDSVKFTSTYIVTQSDIDLRQ